MNPEMSPSNWFESGGSAYAVFRPDYPDALVTYLAGIAPDNNLAVDVGCGTGQLTVRLAEHFRRVIGIDPSADQLAHAKPHSLIEYQQAHAEDLPVSDDCASLVVAAQAAHWFDLPRFYEEVRRIGRKHSILALVSYGAPRFEDGGIQDRFALFYEREIGPFWPPERRIVDQGYANIDFPFPELAAPRLFIQRRWSLNQVLGYFSTWSAWKRALQAGQTQIIQNFQNDIRSLWQQDVEARSIFWPIVIRAGAIK
jgi:SAM-dependent methyltransferase